MAKIGDIIQLTDWVGRDEVVPSKWGHTTGSEWTELLAEEINETKGRTAKVAKYSGKKPKHRGDLAVFVNCVSVCLHSGYISKPGE